MSQKPTYKELEHRIQELERGADDLKRSDQVLPESEWKWGNILIKTPQLCISLDSRAKIVFENEYFLKLTGWRQEKITGANRSDLFIPEEVRKKELGSKVREVFDAENGLLS